MDAQSATHLAIIVLVIICNLFYFSCAQALPDSKATREHNESMPIETIIGAWVATGLTLFIFSFLYKDNPLFKLAENLYVGVSVGYTIVKTYDTVIVQLIWKPIVENGEWALLIPVAIGMLMLTRYVPKAAWISRYAFAFIVGVGSGLAIPRTISSFILKQIEDTVRPLHDVGAGRRRHLYLESPESRQQPEYHHHSDRRQLRAVLLFFLRRAYGARQNRGPDRNPLSDDRVRRGLRVYRDGPHVALDRAIDRSHRVHRSLLWPAEPLALGFDHPYLGGDGPPVQQQSAQRKSRFVWSVWFVWFVWFSG